MTTNIQPLDNRHAVTFNNLATGDDAAKAARFNTVIRMIIELACDSGKFKKITAIKIFRDFAVSLGVDIGLLEAKTTIDLMAERMIIETLRDLLTQSLGSEGYKRRIELLDALDSDINFQKKAEAVRAAEPTKVFVALCRCGAPVDDAGYCPLSPEEHDEGVQGL